MDGDGSRDGLAGAGRSEDQRALEASEARFRAVIANNADGMVVVGEDGLILFANPAAEGLMGRSRGTLVGTEFGRPIVPGETVEVDVVCSDRTTCVAEMRVVETEWDGRPAALASFRDVTDRKNLEEALNRQVAELAEADQQKNTFLAMLAHELRNPLAPVRNAAEVLRLRPGDSQALEWAREMIEQQVEHMTRLVDDLLDVSRITRGKIQLRRSPVRLAKIVSRAVEAARPAMESRGLEVEVAVADPGLGLDADATRMEQVLSNLLNNAAKFTEPGGHVRVSVARAGDEAEIAVEDDGIGLAPEMLDRVFELFAQVDGTLDHSRGGLGIGLTLVRSLVELHGGSVRAESDGRGRGSRFVVRLPVLSRSVSESEGLRDEAPAPLHRLRILVVDDNLHAAESLSMLLKLWGYESRLAHDGQEALDAAAAYGPEVVLLDIGLPVIDGYEVARRLRRSCEHGDALLVAMTGYGQDEDRRKARDAGFDHHMVKPVDLDELRSLLASPESLRPVKPDGS